VARIENVVDSADSTSAETVSALAAISALDPLRGAQLYQDASLSAAPLVRQVAKQQIEIHYK